MNELIAKIIVTLALSLGATIMVLAFVEDLELVEDLSKRMKIIDCLIVLVIVEILSLLFAGIIAVWNQ